MDGRGLRKGSHCTSLSLPCPVYRLVLVETHIILVFLTLCDTQPVSRYCSCPKVRKRLPLKSSMIWNVPYFIFTIPPIQISLNQWVSLYCNCWVTLDPQEGARKQTRVSAARLLWPALYLFSIKRDGELNSCLNHNPPKLMEFRFTARFKKLLLDSI